MKFDPFTAEAIADPYPQYRRFRENDPVHWSEKLRSWVIFRHDDVAAFFRDDERLSSDRSKAAKFKGPKAEAGTPRLRTVATDPPEHVPVRAMLTASLNPRVASLGPRVDELVASLLDRVGEAVRRAVERAELSGEIDLIEDFAYPLPINVIADLFEVPLPDRPQFQDWSHAIARGMDRFYSSSEANQGLQEMGAYFHEKVQERRATNGDDLVHRLLRAEYRADQFSEIEVVAMCTALVFAGHETTVNLLGNGIVALLRNPEALEALRADPASIELAVEEMLRFDSPAQMISRTAVIDFDWRGRRIRAGDAVLAVLGSANRDPQAFCDPDRLDLLRSPNPHISFGLGTHICPGARLTRIEARAAIPALLRRFPRLRFGSAPPLRRPTAVLRGFERLPVRID
jgi:cytochrome P450